DCTVFGIDRSRDDQPVRGESRGNAPHHPDGRREPPGLRPRQKGQHDPERVRANEDSKFATFLMNPTTGAALSISSVRDATVTANGTAVTQFSVTPACANTTVELPAPDTKT